MNQKKMKKIKLIDADALITAVLKNAIDYAVVFGNADMHRLLIQVIAHQPTIDAVPVTRCYECKYIYYEDGLEWKCTRTDTLIGGIEGYCSWAEPEVTE